MMDIRYSQRRRQHRFAHGTDPRELEGSDEPRVLFQCVVRGERDGAIKRTGAEG
jgi:hypothetical protein